MLTAIGWRLGRLASSISDTADSVLSAVDTRIPVNHIGVIRAYSQNNSGLKETTLVVLREALSEQNTPFVNLCSLSKDRAFDLKPKQSPQVSAAKSRQYRMAPFIDLARFDTLGLRFLGLLPPNITDVRTKQARCSPDLQ
jgi:hypothetical protein